MSHFDHEEPQDWNQDADSFEQQLRSVRPAPPMQSWSSIEESIEAAMEQPSAISKYRSTAWRLVASHSITAAVGISLGALMMLQQDKSVATEPKNSRVETSAPVKLVNQQAASDTQTDTNPKQPESLTTVGSLPMRDQHYSPPRPHRLTRTAFRSGPLRAFGSIGNLDLLTQTGDFSSTQNSVQRNEGDDVDFSSEQIDDFPRDKPALSPGSLHLFLDDLTNLPTSDVPSCEAKGCQS